MKRIYGWLAAVLLCAAVVEFGIYAHPALAFTLLFASVIPVWFLTFGRRVKVDATTLGFFAAVIGLALPFTLYNNAPLRVLNSIAFLFCTGTLFLRPLLAGTLTWDKALFQFEAALGWVIRPFAALTLPWKESASITGATPSDETGEATTPGEPCKERRTHPDSAGSARTYRGIALQVLVAVIVAIPVLWIMGSLLSASDSVFARYLAEVGRWLKAQHLLVWGQHLLTLLVIFPFALSSIWTYRMGAVYVSTPTNGTTGKPVDGVADGSGDPSLQNTAPVGSDPQIAPPIGNTPQPWRVPSVFAAVLLGLIDALYLLYALVQFVYLFSGASGILPHGLNYAEYARNGFFELVTISVINVALILVTIYFTQREGSARLILRMLSFVLIALSAVQLVSAFTRMNLYMNAYGLSLLRVFVTAFMVLIAAVFVILTLRECVPTVPVFKAVAFTSLGALILLNFAAPDALVARYNITAYLSGKVMVKTLDLEYLWRELSFDANVVVLEHEQALVQKNPQFGATFEQFHQGLKRANSTPSDTADDLGYGYLVESYQDVLVSYDDDARQKPYTEDYDDTKYYEDSEYTYNVFPHNALHPSWRDFNLGAYQLAQYLN
jgi:hypothetical protein